MATLIVMRCSGKGARMRRTAILTSRSRPRHPLEPTMSQPRRHFGLIFLALLLASTGPAAAFGPLGHRIVGQLAQRQLTPAAAAQVRLLLAGEPEPTLAGVANWADQLRDSDPVFG